VNYFVETYDPTFEDSYQKQVQIDGQSCKLEVLDTAGQDDKTVLREKCIRDGEGFVLVYSISSRQSFACIECFYREIQQAKESSESGSSSNPGTPSASPLRSDSRGLVPVMLVGNKCDAVAAREVSTQEGRALATKLGCNFVEASEKSGANVENTFYNVVRQLRRQNKQIHRTSDRRNTNTAGRQRTYNAAAGYSAIDQVQGKGRRCQCVLL
jgi:GTPase KRas